MDKKQEVNKLVDVLCTEISGLLPAVEGLEKKLGLVLVSPTVKQTSEDQQSHDLSDMSPLAAVLKDTIRNVQRVGEAIHDIRNRLDVE